LLRSDKIAGCLLNVSVYIIKRDMDWGQKINLFLVKYSKYGKSILNEV
jgi:hypothetical protein